MLIICVISGISLIGLAAHLIFYKRQIKELTRQIRFHRQNDSNVSFYLNMNASELKEICEELELYKKDVLKNRQLYEQHEEQMKSQITDISHDIRTPLTSVSGYIQMLQMTEDKEKREEYYDIIRDRLQTLSEMIDDFFVYSKINSKSKQGAAEAVDVKRIFKDVLFTYYDAFLECGINVDVQIDETAEYIYASKEDLERIFLNLIKNVLVHGKNECLISLKYIDTKAEITLTNYTNEVLPDDLSRVYERYYRGDCARSNQKSTGLGLAIVKGLVERNGGSIECFLTEDNRFGIRILFNCLKKDR